MKSKYMLSLVCCAVLSSGCSTHDSNYMDNSYPNGVMSVNAKMDAKILGSLIVLNKNEIAAANLAVTKSTNPAVRNFAELMHKEHNQNLQDTENLSHKIGVMPKKGEVAIMLEKKGHRELASLNRLHNKSFDAVYMADMIKDHTNALNLLDKCIKEAANPMVRQHLIATRAHVAMHLNRAKQIQSHMHH